MNIEPHALPWQEAYKLMIGSIVPRPIAFVSTVDEQGVANVAPFSFFTAICPNPMTVCFSPMVRGSDGAVKDTLMNIRATREFVINIVSESIAGQMNDAAIEFSPDVDEFEATGLTKVQSEIVKAPRVAESPVHLECALEQVLDFGQGPGSGSLVIGRVILIHVHDDVYADGKIDMHRLQAVGRMAGNVFTRSWTDTFSLERKKLPGEMRSSR